MLFNYRCLSLLLILRWLAGEQHQRRIAADDGITSVASLLGARLELHWDSLEERIGSRESTQLDWYKGMTDGKRLSSERYRLHGRIHLLLERTSVGDEGFYTLKLRNQSMIYDQHLFHVSLRSSNLMTGASLSGHLVQTQSFTLDNAVAACCIRCRAADQCHLLDLVLRRSNSHESIPLSVRVRMADDHLQQGS